MDSRVAVMRSVPQAACAMPQASAVKRVIPGPLLLVMRVAMTQTVALAFFAVRPHDVVLKLMPISESRVVQITAVAVNSYAEETEHAPPQPVRALFLKGQNAQRQKTEVQAWRAPVGVHAKRLRPGMVLRAREPSPVQHQRFCSPCQEAMNRETTTHCLPLTMFRLIA